MLVIQHNKLVGASMQMLVILCKMTICLCGHELYNESGRGPRGFVCVFVAGGDLT
jgi:hypothetical protein